MYLDFRTAVYTLDHFCEDLNPLLLSSHRCYFNVPKSNIQKYCNHRVVVCGLCRRCHLCGFCLYREETPGLMTDIAMQPRERLLGPDSNAMPQSCQCAFHTRTHEHYDRHIHLCASYEDGLENDIAEGPKDWITGYFWSRLHVGP